MLTIVGPTSAGKTAYAVEQARKAGGEVISVDSRQVYRGFVIGTGQPTGEE
ncbi:MAG: isopentenyl transferase family protein, partial [Candidatus Neomarinimicrobiota bacterium]